MNEHLTLQRICIHTWRPVRRPVSPRFTEKPREPRSTDIEKACIHCGLHIGGDQ